MHSTRFNHAVGQGQCIAAVMLALMLTQVAAYGQRPARIARPDRLARLQSHSAAPTVVAREAGGALGVSATDAGALVRCRFQQQEGDVTPDGLWLKSTAAGEQSGRFGIRAEAVGREDGGMQPLPAAGRVEMAGAAALLALPAVLVRKKNVEARINRVTFLLA